MTSLSQRLLHTSLPHRLASRTFVRHASTPPSSGVPDHRALARDLIRAPEEDPNPIRPFESNQVRMLFKSTQRTQLMNSRSIRLTISPSLPSILKTSLTRDLPCLVPLTESRSRSIRST